MTKKTHTVRLSHAQLVKLSEDGILKVLIGKDESVDIMYAPSKDEYYKP